jgi:drug/metabolite transporter (DMT)-like permease
MAQTAGERVVRWWLRGNPKKWPEILYALIGVFLVTLGVWDGFHATAFIQGVLVLVLAVVAFERRQYGMIIRRLEEENAHLHAAAAPR